MSGSEAERTLAVALLACLPRQALHACELALAHPVTGRPLRFTCPDPEDLALGLARLREYRDLAAR